MIVQRNSLTFLTNCSLLTALSNASDLYRLKIQHQKPLPRAKSYSLIPLKMRKRTPSIPRERYDSQRKFDTIHMQKKHLASQIDQARRQITRLKGLEKQLADQNEQLLKDIAHTQKLKQSRTTTLQSEFKKLFMKPVLQIKREKELIRKIIPLQKQFQSCKSTTTESEKTPTLDLNVKIVVQKYSQHQDKTEHIESVQQKLKQLKQEIQNFQSLKKSTQSDTVESIVNNLQQKQNKHEALYRYLSFLNGQINELKLQIRHASEARADTADEQSEQPLVVQFENKRQLNALRKERQRNLQTANLYMAFIKNRLKANLKESQNNTLLNEYMQLTNQFRDIGEPYGSDTDVKNGLARLREEPQMAEEKSREAHFLSRQEMQSAIATKASRLSKRSK